ncbi:MAG: PEP/pyruvate-binding domain-containing protein [Phycisphaerae bacterium]
MSRISGSYHCRHVACSVIFAAMGFVTQQAVAETVIPSTSWRNTITFPSDSFRKAAPESGDPGWIKFLIFVSDPTTVYFQDSNAYPFHYDWATLFVQEYIGMSTEEFNQITLYADGQQAILGSVILPYWTAYQPPSEQIKEYGIEFVRRDAYDPAQVVSLFNLVKSKVVADAGVEAFYFPSYDQTASAEENRAYFEANGIIVSSPSRWAKGNISYSRGWALGTLKQFPATQIENAYLTGQLAPGDILLTDGVPADMPIIAGIITLAPSTPNSHVAILANTYGIPFVYLALPQDATRAQQLVGRKIALRVYGNANDCDARLIDVEDVLTPQQIDEILALKTPPPLNICPVTPYGAYSASTDGLWPSDICYFGGKAANFGLLRRSIPENCPVALAFSFDLWNEFLSQTLANGRTLREEIAYRLAGFTYPPANMATLTTVLEGIRENLFKKTSATVFSPALQNAIISTLQDPAYGFDPNKNIRFRSSTNVEDSEQFTGAGLYGSFSGCLADDLDGDAVGPSICDPTEANERGVFRAIRRVFASFYYDNAYLERLRHGIDENQVGMAMLVHHSTPDPIEMANGVATLERISTTTSRIKLVTQLGAVSVSNPTDGSIPEEVKADVYSFGTYLTIESYSNLVPLGATVMTWESDYRTFASLMVQASNAFAAATGKSKYVLDFEYKKVAPEGHLRIKQIREIPQPNTTPSIIPFLIKEPTQYKVFQGEYGEVFGNHRLKSQWTVETKSMWLTPENLNQTIYENVSLEYVDSDGNIRTASGSPADWPEASHSYANNTSTDTWVFAEMGNPRQYLLATSRLGVLVAPSQSPLLTIRDLGIPSNWGSGYLDLRVDHVLPVPMRTYEGMGTTLTDSVRLFPPFAEESGESLQTRNLVLNARFSIMTQFYWPSEPAGMSAGYTAPLARWVETRIYGYTSSPIILHSPYSQTYRPEHHNFSEHFLFEPRLEPGISPSILQELRSKNIRVIYVYRPSSGSPTFTTIGFTTPADFDQDNDVDGTDYDIFSNCSTGPGLGPVEWACRAADFDHDEDVDQADFGVFQRCISGDKVPPDVDCTQ